jgi:hypothetical protein
MGCERLPIRLFEPIYGSCMLRPVATRCARWALQMLHDGTGVRTLVRARPTAQAVTTIRANLLDEQEQPVREVSVEPTVPMT